MKFPSHSGTASRTSLPGSEIQGGPNLLPFPRSGQPQVLQQFSPSRTVAGEWQTPPNAIAGAKENEWFEENLGTLSSVAGLWIAIKGKRMLASSEKLAEILDWLTNERIVDALVVQVPDDVSQDRYMLA